MKSNALTWDERLLLLSFFLYGLASPIFLLFTNAFLWREHASPLLMILYNVGIYSGLGVGFIINRTLLLRISARTLYRVSCVLQGVMPIVLVQFAQTGSEAVFGLGLCSGVALGLYFANRNFFTSKISQGNHRFAFLSLDQISVTVSAIISPIMTGWYLTHAMTVQHLSSVIAYRHVTIAALVFLLCAAFVIQVPESDAQNSTARLIIRRASTRWNAVRMMDFAGGLVHGVFITIPLLVIFTLLTAEVSVGMLQGVAALIGACSVYLIGKHRQKIPHGYLIGIWLVVSFISAMIVAYFFTPLSVIVATVLAGAVGPLYRTSTAHLMYEAVDRELSGERANRLLDRELFLNAGRVIAMVGCAVCIAVSHDFVLRYGYVFALVPNMLLLITALNVSRHLRRA